MNRPFTWIAVALLAGGCASLLDAPVPPINMPLAQAVTQIDVMPRRCPEAKVSIKDRERINKVIRALEGDLSKEWRRPRGAFPKEEYAITFHSRKEVRLLVLGQDWFGGDGIYRTLSKEERVEISALLGIDLESQAE